MNFTEIPRAVVWLVLQLGAVEMLPIISPSFTVQTGNVTHFSDFPPGIKIILLKRGRKKTVNYLYYYLYESFLLIFTFGPLPKKIFTIIPLPYIYSGHPQGKGVKFSLNRDWFHMVM